MVYVNGKSTNEQCFGDVDIYKDSEGNVEKVIFHF